MDKQTFAGIAALSFLVFNIILSTSMYLTTSPLHQQTAQATGGGTELTSLLNPIIDRAINAVENNNTDLALEELDTLKNELKDTYEAEEEEEEDDEDDKKD